jgi:hypothetical protein
MTQHVRSSSPQAAALSTDLIESYCVLGPPSYCVDRLLQFADLGIGRIVIQGAAAGGDRETTLDIERTLIESVLPHIP